MGDKYGSNMFDLLNEEPKKQKAQQKKENVPKADNKGKAAAAPAKKSGNNQGNKSQGQQSQAQSQGGRARGGEGRGRARGRGGRPEGRGRGNDNFAVDGENRQGNNNNRGKQVSRRQREDNFKRGDYGSPDADGRQKRPYDKFSHSAGAKRKQEKKGGAGAGNWGNSKKGEVEQAVPASEEEEKKDSLREFSSLLSLKGNENEESKDKEGEAAEGDEEAKEESDNDIDYDAYLEKKKSEQEELSKLVQTDVRKVDTADYEGLKTLTKTSEENFVTPSGKKKGKKTANTPNGKSVKVDQVLDVRAPAGDNRRRGRQNRPNNQRSNKRNVNLTLDDDKDFPSLGGK